MYIIRLRAIDQLFMLFIFNYKFSGEDMFSYKIRLSQGQQLGNNENLKIMTLTRDHIHYKKQS